MPKQWTRRDFLRTAGTSLVAVALDKSWSWQNLAADSSATTRFYVGTYTDTSSQGIYQGWLDLKSGAMRTEVAATKVVNPSFLTIAPSGQFLYAVNEVTAFDGSPTGGASAFAVDGESGRLRFLNARSSGGQDPCYITYDRAGHFLLVANYTSGSFAVLRMQADGGLAPPFPIVKHQGSGPNRVRQEGPHVHCVAVAPDNRFVIVADLGIDRLMIYAFDAETGSLSPAKVPFCAMPPGSGPRHIVFHPDGKSIFVINELLSTVARLSYRPDTGECVVKQIVSTLPRGYTGTNTAAEICVDAAGRHLYCSNRGHDSVAVFRIQPGSHQLSPVQHQSTQGSFPRSIALDPSGTFLLAANQHSESIVSFAVDKKRGTLTPTGRSTNLGSPVCIAFMP